MKKSSIILLFLVGFTSGVQAQFIKKLGKAAERSAKRTVERRVEKETAEKTDEALDNVFDKNKKTDQKNKKVTHPTPTTDSTGGKQEGIEPLNNTTTPTVHSAKDFERGHKVIFHEQFVQDAIGDFPVTWNTNSSGEVVTFDQQSTRWLKVHKGVFIPDGVTHIPKNSTIEMDIAHDVLTPGHTTGAGSIFIHIAALKNREREFGNWNGNNSGQNGLTLRISPTYPEKGDAFLWNRVDGTTIVKTPVVPTQKWTGRKTSVHLSLWRQDKRLRVYLDDEKIFDLPRVFGDADYNSLLISTGTSKQLYFSNIVVASEAGADTRQRLLETGTFTTSDILFETGKATIDPSSFSLLDEIADVLAGHPDKRLTITGHTDSDGSESSNQILSEQRAESVKNYLVYKHNISSAQITTKGMGELQPLEKDDSPEARARNRRVEFTLH